MRRSARVRPVLLVAAAALAGCTLEPKYFRPAPPVPATFPTGEAYAPVQGNGVAASRIAWTEFFVDPKLKSVIDLALRENRDLRTAAIDIMEARSQYRVQRADLLPTVTGGASATFGRSSNYGISSASTGGTGVGGTSAGATGGLGGPYHIYSVDLGFSAYELDLFGRVRSLSKEAFEQYLATIEARRAAQISIVAEVATDYLTLAADNQRLKTERATLKAEEATLKITQGRFNYGIASLLDVQQAQTAVETARSNVQTFIAQSAQDLNALNLVVGASVPADLLPDGLGDALLTLPEAPAGLSSTVLLNRPDVLQAEHVLRAYNADIGAARAAFFPTLSLTGSGGSTSVSLGQLFGIGTGTYSFNPNLTLPIFDYGRNRANLAYSKAQRDAGIAAYEKAIQTAFTDVADALAQRGTVDALIAAQERLVAATSGTLQLAQARYQQGADTYLSVLTAQLNLASARQTLISARLLQASSLVALYRALGGGLGPQEKQSPRASPAAERGAKAP